MYKKLSRKLKSIRSRALYPYTPASDRLKCIFIHVPKAAGTSLRLALGEPEKGRTHLPWWVYYGANPRKFERYYKFTIVREPCSRLRSAYRYLCQGGNGADDLELSKYIRSFQNFNKFVLEGLSPELVANHQLFRPQTFYICDWAGRIKVDHVGKFENLEQDFRVIASALNLADELEHANRTSVKVEEGMTFSVSEKIYEVYHMDFKMLGYEKPAAVAS